MPTSLYTSRGILAHSLLCMLCIWSGHRYLVCRRQHRSAGCRLHWVTQVGTALVLGIQTVVWYKVLGGQASAGCCFSVISHQCLVDGPTPSQSHRIVEEHTDLSVGDSLARHATRTNLFDRLWRVLAGPRLTVVLIVWIAIIVTVSLVVPQFPAQIDDPFVRSQWLAGIPRGVWPVIERLQPLGVFGLLRSVWLRLPLALLVAHVLVVLANWGPVLWRRGVNPPDVSTLQQWESAGPGRSFQLATDWSEPAVQVKAQVIARLERSGYRFLARDDRQAFVAWRWRWSWLALAGVYIGLGLAALGLILDGWLGGVEEINLEPGGATPLPAAAAPSLVLDSVTVAGDDPGSPTSGVVGLSVLRGVGESHPLTLGLHNSQLLEGMWLTFLDVSPVVEITAVDAETGEQVLLQPFVAGVSPKGNVRLPLAASADVRFAGVPSRNVTLRVDRLDGDDDRSATQIFAVSFFRGVESSPSQSVSLDSGQRVTFGGVRYGLVLGYDVLLQAHAGLWWVLVGAGWGVTVLSLLLLAVVPPVMVRGQVAGGTGGCQVVLTADGLGGQWLRQGMLQLITPDDGSGASGIARGFVLSPDRLRAVGGLPMIAEGAVRVVLVILSLALTLGLAWSWVRWGQVMRDGFVWTLIAWLLLVAGAGGLMLGAMPLMNDKHQMTNNK